jgi:NADPH:quinone reductase-like Zn-dependent oxidoreductase
MKAVVYTEYGPPSVLKVREVDKPKPKDHEILVRVFASSVTAGAILMRKGKHPTSKVFTIIIRLMSGLKKPNKTILGYEVSGLVEQIGKDVTSFNVGDEVFGTTTGLKQGAYADYVCLPEKWKSGVVGIKPSNITHEQAAVIPVAGMTVLNFFNKVEINKEMKILIYGASGSVGSCAVQLAKAYNASVTGVCSSKNFEMVKSLGADCLVDYTKEDFTENGEEYDIIFDAVGKIKASDCKKSLKVGGKYFTVNTPTSEKMIYLNQLKEFVEKGQLLPFIEKVYSLDDVASAHEHADTGRKRGNIAIKIHE